MKLVAYPFVKRPESYYYEFYSEGPNGSIKKVVEYYRLQELEAEVFNLAFGDWDEDSHRINDLSISNNADRERFWPQLRQKDFKEFLFYFTTMRNAASILLGSGFSIPERLPGVKDLNRRLAKICKDEGYIHWDMQAFFINEEQKTASRLRSDEHTFIQEFLEFQKIISF